MLKKIGLTLASIATVMIPKRLLHANGEERKEESDDSVNTILRNRPPTTPDLIAEQLNAKLAKNKK